MMEQARRASKKVKKRKTNGSEGWKGKASWKDITPADGVDFLVGSEEGGFMSLEELDGDVFVGEAFQDMELAKVQKRKRKAEPLPGSMDVAADKNSPINELEVEDKDETVKLTADKGKKKKRKKVLAKKAAESSQKQAESVDGSIAEPSHGIGDGASNRDGVDLESIMSEWSDMRLHSLLIKGLFQLGFKEPTPIQRQCVPAAAYQGKDVVGAAETGSGKTLAFGLPILQRILDEKEKAARKTGQGSIQEVAGESKSEGGLLRALIVTPTRELAIQVCDHLRAAAKFTGIRVAAIVGGMAPQKQQRVLRGRPEIVVATPGRLWELMSAGEQHLLKLHCLSFFVLDEADRMVEKGHFKELQSIIDLLPSKTGSSAMDADLSLQSEQNPSLPDDHSAASESQSAPGKKRQTMVFSATLSLPPGFRRKLKHRNVSSKDKGQSLDSVADLIHRLGMSEKAAIVDLTTKTLVAGKLQEAVIQCMDSEKDVYLCHFLCLHGQGRSLVFCTSIAAVRRVASIFSVLKFNSWALHAQMQQRQRLKNLDRFRASEDGVLIATDVAARGLDIAGVRSVVHYQMPHEAEVYIHRCGRTARAGMDGCSVALLGPTDRVKYNNLMLALGKATGLPRFPVNQLYFPQVRKCVQLAVKIDETKHQIGQKKADANWSKRNAEELGLDEEEEAAEGKYGSSKKQRTEGDGTARGSKIMAASIRAMEKELERLLEDGIRPKSFSKSYFTGKEMASSQAEQIQTVNQAKKKKKGTKSAIPSTPMSRKSRFVVIGHESLDAVSVLQRLAGSGKNSCPA